MPVARIVMHQLMPQARLAHLAELVAAGVLRTKRIPSVAGSTGPAAPGSRTHRSEVALSFAPGLRELLQRSLTVTMTLQVWRAVAPYLEATRKLPRFSLLLQPSDAATTDSDAREGMRAIAADLAARLGLVPVPGVTAATPSPAAGSPTPATEPPAVWMTDRASLSEAALVRLVRRDGRRSTAGLGVLVGAHEVVTFAHVVNAALGLDLREQARPAASTLVRLEFPLLPGAPMRAARVEAWVPPLEIGAGGGDVAGLVLNEDAPAGAAPARFAGQVAMPGGRLRVFGYPQDPPREYGAWVDVELKGQVGTQLILVESRGDQTIKAQPGYSGSPVWDDSAGVVVGLLHASAFADQPHRDAFLLPAGMVAEAWKGKFDYLLVPVNPYRGLEPFTVEHAAMFFGRDGDIEALAARVIAQTVVVVIGPAGVGKSSLVQAGLIPRLRRDQDWSVAIVRPGQDPWHRLAAALLLVLDPTGANSSKPDVEREIERLRSEGFGPMARFLRSEGRPLLVVVDQFEELLAGRQPPEPELLDLLLPSPETADDATHLVHTLRADFLPTLLAIQGVGARLDQRLYPLSPLSENQLRNAIEEPAKARGVMFQEGLVEQIIDDAAGGSLPLLEFTLFRLWLTQQRKIIDFDGYHSMGGMHGAFDRFAEEQVSTLSGATADAVDRVLLRLVGTAAGEPGMVTRRRVYQSTLSVAEWQTMRHLADARLVIVDTDPVGGPYAELAHEALITSWERLRHLVRDNTEFLGWLNRIQQRAADEDPLPEARIAEARRWVETRPDDVPDFVKAFIDNSQTAAEARLRELNEARIGAEAARREVETAHRRADRRAETLRLEHDGSVTAVAFAPDGTRVATGSEDGSARVFDAATGAELARLEHDDGVRTVMFDLDGTRVATGSRDRSARVFHAATGVGLARIDHDGSVTAVAFSPDGTLVATASRDGSARLLEAGPADLLSLQ